MKKYFYLFIITFVVSSCSDNPTTGEVSYQNSEILVTNEYGVILGGDYSDWCMSDTGGFLRNGFGPAYPNPAEITFHVPFSLPVASEVDMYFTSGIDTLFVLNGESLVAGHYSITIATGQYPFQNVIKKLYFISRGTDGGVFRCEGDVKFVN